MVPDTFDTTAPRLHLETLRQIQELHFDLIERKQAKFEHLLRKEHLRGNWREDDADRFQATDRWADKVLCAANISQGFKPCRTQMEWRARRHVIETPVHQVSNSVHRDSVLVQLPLSDKDDINYRVQANVAPNCDAAPSSPPQELESHSETVLDAKLATFKSLLVHTANKKASLRALAQQLPG